MSKLNSSNINAEHQDVVNEKDFIIGTKSRDEIHHLGLLHREVHVWLFNKEKSIYFQKTASHKSNAGLFDSSIGGHVDVGEEYISAAVRETQEESGLRISSSDLFLLNKFRGVSENKTKGTVNNFIRSVYIYKYPINDNEIKIDPKENDGFKKFPIDFLSHISEEKKTLFHKFVLTHELPFVFNYLNNL